MIRYFTPNVTYSTYVNCNIKIITQRQILQTDYKKKAHLKHFIIKSKSLYVKKEISSRYIYVWNPRFYTRTAIPSL